MKATVWTPERVAALRTRYLTDGGPALAAEFGLTAFAVRTKAKKLGIQRARATLWTAAEDEVIRQNYPDKRLRWIADRLPGRTAGSVGTRAFELGISKKVYWTDAEDADLARLYAAGNGAKVLEAYFGRTFAAIARRACKLGVRRPADPKVWTPERCEYLRQHYATTSNTVLGKHFGQSGTSIATQARKMGLTKATEDIRHVKAKAKAKVLAAVKPEPKPDYRAEKRPPCGKERKASAAKAKPAEPVKKWYNYPRGSAEYKAGEAAYFAGKRAESAIDNYGRPVIIYTNAGPRGSSL